MCGTLEQKGNTVAAASPKGETKLFAEKARRAWVKALTLMRKTYKDATAVLVLDSWLLESCSIQDPHVDILIKIFACDWQSRLWTFQEGALAKRLFFQLRDGAYDLDHGMEQLASSSDNGTALFVTRALEALHRSIRSFRKDTPVQDRLAAAATSFAHRTTSVLGDEPLCLATLIGLDSSVVEKIAVETDVVQKKRLFWGSLDKLPVGLLFTTSPRLPIEGLRWAPKSMLQSHSPDSVNSNSAICGRRSPDPVSRRPFLHTPLQHRRGAVVAGGQGQPVPIARRYSQRAARGPNLVSRGPWRGRVWQ